MARRLLDNIRMHRNFLRSTVIALALMATTFGCSKGGNKPVIVDVSVKNASSNRFDWVKVEWNGPDIPVGVLPEGGFATSVGVPWPNLPSIKLSFVDDKTRQPHEIQIALEAVNQKVLSGQCREIALTILTNEKGEAVCE